MGEYQRRPEAVLSEKELVNSPTTALLAFCRSTRR
jgi:hypothetical protein